MKNSISRLIQTKRKTKLKIQIKEKSNDIDDEHWFKEIINSLESLNCERYLIDLTSFSQKEQKKKVKKLQNYIYSFLKKIHTDFNWSVEHKISKNRDAFDIYGERGDEILIIELDKWRADQVAKKFFSRTALMIDKKIGFISICYGGTKNMSKNECLKYFKYANILSSKLQNYYAGIMIE